MDLVRQLRSLYQEDERLGMDVVLDTEEKNFLSPKQQRERIIEKEQQRQADKRLLPSRIDELTHQAEQSVSDALANEDLPLATSTWLELARAWFHLGLYGPAATAAQASAGLAFDALKDGIEALDNMSDAHIWNIYHPDKEIPGTPQAIKQAEQAAALLKEDLYSNGRYAVKQASEPLSQRAPHLRRMQRKDLENSLLSACQMWWRNALLQGGKPSKEEILTVRQYLDIISDFDSYITPRRVMETAWLGYKWLGAGGFFIGRKARKKAAAIQAAYITISGWSGVRSHSVNSALRWHAQSRGAILVGWHDPGSYARFRL